MSVDLPSFTCPRCQMTSYSPDDIREGYCGKCHGVTGRRDDSPRFINGRSMYLDRQGKPIGLYSWADLHDDHEYRVIGKTIIAGFEVSTVWLGMDHSFGFGPPLFFETMIFRPELKYSELFGRWFHEEVDFQERYPSEGAAWAGHWVVCFILLSQWLLRGLPPGQPRMIEGR